MDVKEMLAKLDYFYEQGRLKEAEKLLDSSLEDAKENRNYSAMLTIYNEMEGLYRTTGRADKAADISDKALSLIVQMGLGNTTHHATTLQNGATANRVAGNCEKALDMYCQAAEIYKNLGMQTSYQMASLYNNISHIYQQQNRHEKALNTVSQIPDSEAEIATTKVGLGLCLMSVKRMDESKTQLLEALDYYESPLGASDGHYGSALSAMGEYMWRQKAYENAIAYYEKALRVTLERFGENYGCKIIRSNLDKIKNEMENTSTKG